MRDMDRNELGHAESEFGFNISVYYYSLFPLFKGATRRLYEKMYVSVRKLHNQTCGELVFFNTLHNCVKVIIDELLVERVSNFLKYYREIRIYQFFTLHCI